MCDSLNMTAKMVLLTLVSLELWESEKQEPEEIRV